MKKKIVDIPIYGGKHGNKSNLCKEKGIKLLHIRENLWNRNKEKESEIPQYAGLIYVEGKDIKVIKKAPKLHSFKATDKLIRKVCDLLSVRAIFGSSYMNYISKFKNYKYEKD